MRNLRYLLIGLLLIMMSCNNNRSGNRVSDEDKVGSYEELVMIVEMENTAMVLVDVDRRVLRITDRVCIERSSLDGGTEWKVNNSGVMSDELVDMGDHTIEYKTGVIRGYKGFKK